MATTEPLPADPPLTVTSSSSTRSPDPLTYLRPRRAARRDWFRVGFFFALGAVVLALLSYVVWRLTDAVLAVATPFVIAAVLALLLDPLVDKLERRGLSRMWAATLVFVGLLALVIGGSILLTPILVGQAGDLAKNGPQLVSGVKDNVNHFLDAHPKIGPVTLPHTFADLTGKLSDRVAGLLQSSSGQLAGYLLGSVTLVIQTILVLIVTFFLLLDVDRLRARLFFLAPEKARGMMGQLGSDVGGVFSDYLAGLVKVCVLYGVATTLVLYGLAAFPGHHTLAHYALLVGFLAGFLYAVPYIGSTATALITFLVAFAAGGFQFGVVGIIVTLILNQIFDNVITPRVVGGGVGLHPVLAIFALVLGGEMFGIWGMLLSVPVAASIQAILFRLYPKLTTPTPPTFLRAQGVRADQEESSKILEGDESVTTENKRREKQPDGAS